MPKAPILKPTEVVRLLEALQFKEIRQRGSHKQYSHSDDRATTVPFHKGRDISHQFYYDKLLKMLDLQLKNLLKQNK